MMKTLSSQFVGKFKSIDGLVHITLLNGEDFTLPPDLSSFQPAEPGIYTLRSTGEKVENPDYTTGWTVRQPKSKKKRARKRDEMTTRPPSAVNDMGPAK